MGMHFSHECWRGPVTLFGRFRVALARTIGIWLPAMEGYEDHWQSPHNAPKNGEHGPDGISWDHAPPDPLHFLLTAPDSEATILWRHCKVLADRIEFLIPRLGDLGENAGFGTWKELAEKFAAGLRRAYEAKQDVEWSG